jgi:hypothetical protein
MFNREIRETPSPAKSLGKKPDLTRMWAKKSEESNPVERIELASVSTREKPKMLGGTLEDAHNYYKENLSRDERDQYKEYKRYERRFGTKEAAERCETGYEINKEYNRRYHRKQYDGPSSSRQTEGELRLTESEMKRRKEQREWWRDHCKSLGYNTDGY